MVSTAVLRQECGCRYAMDRDGGEAARRDVLLQDSRSEQKIEPVLVDD